MVICTPSQALQFFSAALPYLPQVYVSRHLSGEKALLQYFALVGELLIYWCICFSLMVGFIICWWNFRH